MLIDKWTEIVLDQDNLSECIHSWFSKFGQGATVTPTYHSSQIAKLVTLVATFILADMNEVPTDMSHLICFYFYIGGRTKSVNLDFGSNCVKGRFQLQNVGSTWLFIDMPFPMKTTSVRITNTEVFYTSQNGWQEIKFYGCHSGLFEKWILLWSSVGMLLHSIIPDSSQYIPAASTNLSQPLQHSFISSGQYGGSGGGYFSDNTYFLHHGYIQSLMVRTGTWVDAIQARYVNFLRRYA